MPAGSATSGVLSGKSISLNASALIVGRVLGAATALIVTSVSAHRLSADEFGLVVAVLAAGFLANSAVTFGTDIVIARSVAAQAADAAATVRSALRMQLIASVSLTALGVVVWQIGNANSLVALQASVLVPMAVITVASAVLRGRERMDLLTYGSAMGSVVTLVFALVGFSLANDPWIPIAAFGVGAVVSSIMLAVFAKLARLIAPVSAGRPLIREAAPFAAMVVLAAVSAQVGTVLVELASSDPAGGYGAAVRITEAARLVPAAVVGALFPRMISKQDAHELGRWRVGLVGYAIVATAAIAVAAGVINRVVFDNQQDGALLIRLLALGLVFTVIRLTLSFELIAAGHERAVLVSAVIGTVVTLAGALVAVGTYGAPGVAVAHVVGIIAATSVLAKRSREQAAGSLVAAGEPLPGSC